MECKIPHAQVLAGYSIICQLLSLAKPVEFHKRYWLPGEVSAPVTDKDLI
ncbi:hypothetical protein TAMC210_02480 [Thermanaeromonas sp. C210]|nr:hypothetical protein TAMC210_02480 [Thermanaeromonas sp. C210]